MRGTVPEPFGPAMSQVRLPAPPIGHQPNSRSYVLLVRNHQLPGGRPARRVPGNYESVGLGSAREGLTCVAEVRQGISHPFSVRRSFLTRVLYLHNQKVACLVIDQHEVRTESRARDSGALKRNMKLAGRLVDE